MEKLQRGSAWLPCANESVFLSFSFFFTLVCILPSHVWRLSSTPTVHPDSLRSWSRLPFQSYYGGERRKKKKTQSGAHRIQLTAQQILEDENKRESEVSDAVQFHPPECVFSPTCPLHSTSPPVGKGLDWAQSKPEINVERPDAWQAVCRALLQDWSCALGDALSTSGTAWVGRGGKNLQTSNSARLSASF